MPFSPLESIIFFGFMEFETGEFFDYSGMTVTTTIKTLYI